MRDERPKTFAKAGSRAGRRWRQPPGGARSVLGRASMGIVLVAGLALGGCARTPPRPPAPVTERTGPVGQARHQPPALFPEDAPEAVERRFGSGEARARREAAAAAEAERRKDVDVVEVKGGGSKKPAARATKAGSPPAAQPPVATPAEKR